MAEIKFTNAEDEQLIELVAKNPVLFDPQIESYKDPNIRIIIWKDIAAKMDRNGDCLDYYLE